MSYQEQSNLYTNLNERSRMEMCAREQALIFSVSAIAEVAALSQGVIGGNLQDLDAIVAAVCVHQNWSQIAGGDDTALLGAVQNVWPTVAIARYPQEV